MWGTGSNGTESTGKLITLVNTQEYDEEMNSRPREEFQRMERIRNRGCEGFLSIGDGSLAALRLNSFSVAAGADEANQL
jgi:hypothetical protein